MNVDQQYPFLLLQSHKANVTRDIPRQRETFWLNRLQVFPPKESIAQSSSSLLPMLYQDTADKTRLSSPHCGSIVSQTNDFFFSANYQEFVEISFQSRHASMLKGCITLDLDIFINYICLRKNINVSQMSHWKSGFDKFGCCLMWIRLIFWQALFAHRLSSLKLATPWTWCEAIHFPFDKIWPSAVFSSLTGVQTEP